MGKLFKIHFIIDKNRSLWSLMEKYAEEGYLMGAGSPSGSDENVSAFGIVQGHAYAILDVEEVQGNKLIQMKNPWGQGVDHYFLVLIH